MPRYLPMVPALLSAARLKKHNASCLVVPLVCLLSMCAGHARAESTLADPPTDPSAAQSSTQDDDATLRPAEPDYRLINLPTTLRLPLYRGNFDLTHRFNGNLRRGDFDDQLSNLFGLDNGAVIGLEFRFAVARHLEAAVYRTSFDKTFQFYGKYDAISQNASMPVSVSGLVSVEGRNNFREDRSPSLGAVISRTLHDRIAVYATPIWVNNSAAAAGVNQNTFFVGLGGRVRLLETVYVVTEVSPRVAGYAPGKAEYGFAIEKRAGLHMFQLNFSNSQGTTFGELARGGFPDTLFLGFNLARKFF